MCVLHEAVARALVFRLLELYSVVFLDYPSVRNKAAGNARSGILVLSDVKLLAECFF